MTTEDLKREADSTLLSMLQEKNVYPPAWEKLNDQYDSEKHPVCSTIIRPDKIKKGKGKEPVSRIHLDLEKLITTRMVEFMFAIPVNRVYSGVDDDEVKVQNRNAIEAVYKSVRIDTENLERAKELFAACEVNEINC